MTAVIAEALGVMAAAGRSSGRRPRPPDQAGAAAAGVTVAAVVVGAVAEEAARRQVVVAGAERIPLEKRAGPRGSSGGPLSFFSPLLQSSAHVPAPPITHWQPALL